MNDIFSYTKLFTILLVIYYIMGLLGVFFDLEILFILISFISLSVFVLFFNLDYKKTIVLCLIFLLGILRANQAQCAKTPFENVRANKIIVKGQVVSSKNISIQNNRVKFFVMAQEVELYKKKYDNLNVKLLVSSNIEGDLTDKITIGDYVEFEGKLRQPKPAANPYQFDYRQYLLNNDTKSIVYLEPKSFKVVKKPEFSFKNKRESWYYILQLFELTRNNIIQQHSKNIKSPYLEVLGGIVFGNETVNPDEEVKESFKHSGLLHLLAASGLNVALIFGIWWWIANLAKLPYRLSIFSGAVFVVIYTFMTGFPPSILRASIMLLFVLFAKLIDRSVNSLALIFFVAFLILLFSPKMLFDIGFQLSFMVTAGLVSCCDVIVCKFDKWDKKYKEKYEKTKGIKKYFLYLFSPKNLAAACAVPFVAQLWVAPLQMHYFNTFAPLSIFANLMVVPFIGILSFIGFLSSIFALIPFLNDFIVYIFDLAANPLLILLISISRFFSSFKISLVSSAGLNLFQIFGFWALISFGFYNLKNNFKNRKNSLIFFSCVLIFLLSFIKLDNFSQNLEIIMFDVENADSFLIKTPKNKYILIDAGKKPYNSFSSAQSVINPYFRNERINKLEKMIITHFDSDHSGGAIDILKAIKVKQTIIQKNEVKSKISRDILNYLSENKINYAIAQNNDEIYKEKDLTIKTYTPFVSSIKNDDKFDNETSTVVLLQYKNKNILFMADVGVEGFYSIEKYLSEKIDIIKVGHHGAYNSLDEKMLDSLKPDYALISTGYNRFNHPHDSTLNFLQNKNVKIISTKDYGFSKILIKDKIKFYHYDNKTKLLKPVLFDKCEDFPFNQTKEFQDIIKSFL